MNELLAKDLRDVVETVWTATLGFEMLDPLGSMAPPPEATWCGCIQIGGAWNGLVKVSISEALARRAAATMFDSPAESLSDADVTDALGEITNMTGGSVKALLPGPSQLSLPSVITGVDFSVISPGGTLIREVAFQTSGSQIRVQVVEGRRLSAWDGIRQSLSAKPGPR